MNYEVRMAVSSLINYQLLDVVRSVEVLVIAIRDALEVKNQLLVREALVEAHLRQVFLRRLDVLNFVILIHYFYRNSCAIELIN